MIKQKFKIVNSTLVLFVSLLLFSCNKVNNLNEKISEKEETTVESESYNLENYSNLIDLEKFFFQTTKIGSERAQNQNLKDVSLVLSSNHNKILASIKSTDQSNKTDFNKDLPEDLNKKLYGYTITNAADFDVYLKDHLILEYNRRINDIAKELNDNKSIESKIILEKMLSNYEISVDALKNIKL